MNKLNKKITKKELSKKDDYLVIEIFHERYCFDTNVLVKNNTSIKNILENYFVCGDLDINKLERAGYHGMGYIYDNCGRVDYDNYPLTKKEKKRFSTYHIDTLLIVSRHMLRWEESFCTCWGSTNKKYGLVDYNEFPGKMDENKSLLSKLKYKWLEFKYRGDR